MQQLTKQIIGLYEEVKAMVLADIEGQVEHEDTLCLWFFVEDGELHINFCDTDAPSDDMYPVDSLIDVDMETGSLYPDMVPICKLVDQWYEHYKPEF